MAVMKVVQAPAEVLNQVAKRVTFKEAGLKKLLLDMEETLLKHEDPPGVGLAAPQVGVSLRIFVARIGFSQMKDEDLPGHVEVFINPEILKVSGDSSKSKEGRKTAEGCLSLKDYYGDVNRGTKVKIKYENVDLNQLRSENSGVRIQNLVKEKEKIYEDLEARIMQHEMDHLEGRLFTMRVLEQGEELYRVEKDKKGREVFVPVEIGEVM